MGQQERLMFTKVDKDIGHWVANLRAEQGLTQWQLAHRCHTAQSAISRFENGRVSPSLHTLTKMFNSMGLEMYLGAKQR